MGVCTEREGGHVHEEALGSIGRPLAQDRAAVIPSMGRAPYLFEWSTKWASHIDPFILAAPIKNGSVPRHLIKERFFY